jgi:HK97 gp10 family phage protein
MPEIRLTFVPSLDKLGDVFKNIAVSNFVSFEINEIAMKIVGFGKQLSPVDTGLMRSRISQTIFSTPASLKAKVETGVFYSIYVHEGTRYMRGRPFLETGANLASANFAGNISNRIEKGFAQAFKAI